MKPRLQAVALLLLSIITAVAAIDLTLSQKDGQQCSGMYSKKSWGGNVEPFILVKFVKNGERNKDIPDPIVSVVIWEWKDSLLLGKPSDKPVDDRHYICNEDTIGAGLCNATHRGEWLLADDTDTVSKMHVRTAAIDLNDPKPINYPVGTGDRKLALKTGFYCVATAAYNDQIDYEAIVTFRNAYGELPAADIAKLPFYGGITIVYFVVLAFWGFLYFQNRHDILAVQNYITAILVFLVVEMMMTWGFYDYQNRHGNNVGTKVLLIMVAVLNAFRNSFSFFLLLIVCMGYGVVKPTLGKTMTIVRWLAVAHFVFGVIYAIGSLTVQADDAGPLVLLVILPLSATLTAFYIWTLNSLNFTMKDLMERKQHVKAAMYKRLWWCILTSIIVIFGFFFLNSFTLAGASNAEFRPTHWQTRWFVLDGWLNIVYLADVCFVAYMWRPTVNNRRFAMSDEIAQDDEGFEIASLRDSLDEEEGRSDHPPSYDPAPRQQNFNRDVSPLPAPKPTKPIVPPRESLDGDTIFAVGEDDKWSSDDEDDEMEPSSPKEGDNEYSRLTGPSRKND